MDKTLTYDNSKAMLCRMKLKFDCGQCKKSWSSACGTAEILYQANPIIKESGAHAGIRLKVKILVYPQKCNRCGKMGNMTLYDEDTYSLSEKLTIKVLNELGYEVPKPKKEGKGSNMRKTHEKALCLACHAGKCFFTETRRRRRRNLDNEVPLRTEVDAP